jgi:UDP-N-acetylglucosamine 2-epimerase
VVGARPQFVKAAAVSPVLRGRHREVLLHTGQHYDDAMSDQFFRELDIPTPDIELGVGSGRHGEQTARMLIGIETGIADIKPDAVLVYGDTNSTLAGALAAAKMHVPVAHVEAGLRSFNRLMPEEINRTVTDALSSLLFCPSETAVANLRREGITGGVHNVGDVMGEVVKRFADRVIESARVSRLGLRKGEYVVATVHRAENTDGSPRLAAILHALNRLPLPVVFPLHPRTRSVLGAHAFAPHVHVVEPLGYGDMIAAVRHAHAVVTDSGGLQKEAYWLGVPCVTLRDETEWVETVASGWNTLVGADTDRIVEVTQRSRPTIPRPPLYGEGDVVTRIVGALERIA